MSDGPRYYRVSPKLWQEPSWDDDTRLLALYILTCDHRTTEGLFRLPRQYILADLDWSPQRLAQPFKQLCADGFMDYDEDAKVLLITKALKYQAPSNPNGVVSALRALEMVPATRLDSVFYELSERYSERLAEALTERFTEPFGQPPALTPALTPAPNPLPDGSGDDGGFEEFWNVYPRHHDTKATGGGGNKRTARKRWRALSAVERAEVTEAVGPYAKLCGPNGQKPKHAERFLIGEAWQPYLPAARDGPARESLCRLCARPTTAPDHDELCSVFQ